MVSAAYVQFVLSLWQTQTPKQTLCPRCDDCQPHLHEILHAAVLGHSAQGLVGYRAAGFECAETHPALYIPEGCLESL